MSTTRSSSAYNLFPICPPLSVSGCSKDIPVPPSSGDKNIPTRKLADIPTEVEGVNSGVANNQSLAKSTNNPLVLVNRKLKRSWIKTRMIPLKLGKSFDTRTASPTATSQAIFAQTSKSIGQTSGPVTDLIILPYTENEWRMIMAEVKNLYLKGQYKHCSMRCKETLDGIKDSCRVHPLYLVYLSFFAASSLEVTASSLHQHSSRKLPLYQEALVLYQSAANYIYFATFSADHPLCTSRGSIAPSSPRSSIDSVFSHHSPASSVASLPLLPHHSPSASLRSHGSDEEGGRSLTPEPLRTKKKVTFSPSTLPSPQLPIRQEFGVRLMTPAPTNDPNTLLDAFPSPPSRPVSRSQTPEREANPIESVTEPEQGTRAQEGDSLSAHLLHLSGMRYRKLLQSFDKQLQYHISSTQEQIATLTDIRKSRRGGVVSMEGLAAGLSGEAEEEKEERRKVELRERVRRMKEKGWERKRFDGERYRRLAETALKEIEEGSL